MEMPLLLSDSRLPVDRPDVHHVHLDGFLRHSAAQLWCAVSTTVRRSHYWPGKGATASSRFLGTKVHPGPQRPGSPGQDGHSQSRRYYPCPRSTLNLPLPHHRRPLPARCPHNIFVHSFKTIECKLSVLGRKCDKVLCC